MFTFTTTIVTTTAIAKIGASVNAATERRVAVIGATATVVVAVAAVAIAVEVVGIGGLRCCCLGFDSMVTAWLLQIVTYLKW